METVFCDLPPWESLGQGRKRIPLKKFVKKFDKFCAVKYTTIEARENQRVCP